MDLLAPGVRRRAEAESTWSNSKAAHHMRCFWSFVFPSRFFWALWAPRLWWFTIIFADCLDFLSLLLAVWQFTVEWPTGRAHKGATWGSCFDVVENYPCTNLIACNVFLCSECCFYYLWCVFSSEPEHLMQNSVSMLQNGGIWTRSVPTRVKTTIRKVIHQSENKYEKWSSF